MPHIRDFEPIIPDPQPHIERALALYDKAVRYKRGRIVFIAAELGGGKTEHLSALAKALHQAKPEPAFVAGYFSRGEYHRYTLAWQKNICLSKAALVAGETAALLGFYSSPYALAMSLIGQLLQTSVNARELGEEFRRTPSPRKEGADWLRKILRRAAEERPLVCLLDNWEEAQRFFWDDMLLSFSKEIAHSLPLLLFITVKEPIDLKAPDKDESGLAHVIKTLTEEKGLAEWWPLRKLSRDEVGAYIGKAALGIAGKLHGVTGGNARWVRELWREWRQMEIVIQNETDCWVWGGQHRETVNLYELILRDRLARLLKAQTAMEVEEVCEVLACAALEGVRFTADALAVALGLDRDELIDFLDETLVHTEDNPNGLLLDDDSVSITKSNGETRTLWRYKFASDLHWMALERYGFENHQQPDKNYSEKMEKSIDLAQALIKTYSPEERLVAAPLAKLFAEIGNREAAQHYRRMAYYSASRAVLREQALHLLTLNKDEWGQWECQRTARFMLDVGNAIINTFPHSEALIVLTEAHKLAHRAKDRISEADAHYLCGFVHNEAGEYSAARDSANKSLNIIRHTNSKSGLAKTLSLFSDINYAEGHYAEALDFALQSKKIYQEIDNRLGIAHTLQMLSDINHAESHYTEARKCISQAIKIYQEIGEQLGIVNSLNRMGRIEYAEGHYVEARECALKSLKIYQEIGEQLGIASAFGLLAMTDCAEGHYVEAREHALKSLKITQGMGDHRGVISSLDLLDVIARKSDRVKEALHIMILCVLIKNQIGYQDAQQAQSDLMVQLTEQGYTKEQQQELFRQISEAYRKDGGIEWIENTLARWRDAEN